MARDFDFADRMAPGELALVQEFIWAAENEPTEAELQWADGMRLRHQRGASQAALANEFGVSQRLVSAVVRGKMWMRGPSGTDVEGLMSTGAAGRWLSTRNLLEGDRTVSEADLDRLRELRQLLQQMTLANNGVPLPAGVLKALNEIARKAPLVVSFGAEEEQELLPAAGGIDGAIGRLLAIVFEARRAGSWSRLKTCPGEGCFAVFYDTSRNRTATWCSMAICGNREKVGKYQARRRAERKAAAGATPSSRV